MKRRWPLIIGLVLALGVGAWVARGMAARKATGAAAAAASAPVSAIELSPNDVAKVQQSELTQTLAISGSLKAVQSAVIKARVAAEVKALSVREGDRVAAGQLLGRLDTTEFEWRLRQAEDQAASAKAQLDIAERTLDNNKALVDQGFISRNALDTAASTANGARAALQAAQAAAELARKAVRDCEIRSPIAGLVSQRLVQPGERVSVDARLVEVVDLSQIELEAAVAPEDVPALRVGQVARVRVDGLEPALSARVVRINPSAVAGTRAVTAYLLVDKHPALRQGLFARGEIELGRRLARVVPVSALRLDQARPTVMLMDKGVAVERTVRPLARGEASFGGRREPAVEIQADVGADIAAGMTVLRGTVGSLRAGTRLTLAGATTAAAAATAAAATAAAAAPATPAASASQR